jgi:putative nucleotidyltransferase with HDIG domain
MIIEPSSVTISGHTLGRGSQVILDELLEGMTRHDEDLGTHVCMVSKLALLLGRRIGLKGNQLAFVGAVALLHDIGKMKIPTNILNSPNSLSPEEWDLIHRHPEMGGKILESYPALHTCISGVVHHHERWDGKGYPDKLEGLAIPIESRIVAIADTFAVITHRRNYQAERSLNEALSELKRCSRTQFDPFLTNLAIQAFEVPIVSAA